MQLLIVAIEQYGTVCLGGDSAGGQIALSAALLQRDEHQVTLPRTALISPAVDLSMTNPEIDAVQPSDSWLGRDGVREFIELSRADLPLTDARVSPLVAGLAGLGPVSVFCGTRDILHPDVRLLVDKASAAGVDVELHEQPGLVHVFPLTPTRRGRDARRLVVARVAAAVRRDGCP